MKPVPLPPADNALDALQDLYRADRQPGDDKAATRLETALQRQYSEAMQSGDDAAAIYRLSGQVKAAAFYRSRIVEQTPSRKAAA